MAWRTRVKCKPLRVYNPEFTGARFFNADDTAAAINACTRAVVKFKTPLCRDASNLHDKESNCHDATGRAQSRDDSFESSLSPLFRYEEQC